MPEAEPSQHTETQADSAFRSRSFRNYQLARFLVILGAEAQSVAVAWQVYQLTHSALLLGGTGLVLFLPGVLFVLPAGHAADRFSRKGIILLCYGLQTLCTVALFYLAYTRSHSIAAVYGTLLLVGVGRAFSGPASSAILPSLVPKHGVVNAMTWGSAIYQTANISGPAVGGLLFTLALPHAVGKLDGAPLVYLLTLLTNFCFLGLVSTIQPRAELMEKKAFTIATMLAGMHYVRRARLLLGSISLDMFAVLLGGATSLMPIFAQDILHAGPRGLGLLRAAPAIGALTISIVLARRPIQHSAGKLMLVCVGIFGAATIGFGLSRSVPLSLLMLLLIGASDNVSVIIRSSILQLGTPPEMRGRVSAVNWLFIGASNEFGEFESGLTAHWFGAVRAVVFGGIGSVLVTGACSVLFPTLRNVSTLTQKELLAANTYGTAEPID